MSSAIIEKLEVACSSAPPGSGIIRGNMLHYLSPASGFRQCIPITGTIRFLADHAPWTPILDPLHIEPIESLRASVAIEREIARVDSYVDPGQR